MPFINSTDYCLLKPTCVVLYCIYIVHVFPSIKHVDNNKSRTRTRKKKFVIYFPLSAQTKNSSKHYIFRHPSEKNPNPQMIHDSHLFQKNFQRIQTISCFNINKTPPLPSPLSPSFLPVLFIDKFWISELVEVCTCIRRSNLGTLNSGLEERILGLGFG